MKRYYLYLVSRWEVLDYLYFDDMASSHRELVNCTSIFQV